MQVKLRPIQQQVVVLFGATSGIGLETALRMVEKGARVAIIGRSKEGVDMAVDRVCEHLRVSQLQSHRDTDLSGLYGVQDRVLGIEADTTHWEQVRNAAEEVVATYGRIDTWVHLAGVGEWALFEDTTPEEFQQIIQVNLVGQAYGAMAALPYLKQQGGALIFVASILGRIPMPYQSAYVASKHGIIGMADSLRMEVEHNQQPVSVTTILPSSINTPMFNKARTKIGSTPMPMPPIYSPDTVAKAILYAAQNPVPEITVGGGGYMMQSLHRVSRPAVRGFMRSGFAVQHSDDPKSADAPHNLYQHIEGYNLVEGEYSAQTMRFSLYTWLKTHPLVRFALMGAALGGAIFLGVKLTQEHKQLTFWQQLAKRASDVKMPRLLRKATFQQKVVRQAGKVAHNLPLNRASWWQGLPLLGMIPMFQKKTPIERAKGRLDKTVAHLGKSARSLNKVSSRLEKTAAGISERSSDFIDALRPAPPTPMQRGKAAFKDLQSRAADLNANAGKTVEKWQEKLPRPGKDTLADKIAEQLPEIPSRDRLIDKLPFR